MRSAWTSCCGRASSEERRCSASASGCSWRSSTSSELGGAEGLGLIAGEVHGLRAGSLKLPHIGWNEVRFTKPESALIAGLPLECAFYHVHSLAAEPAREEDVLGVAEYGAPFVTAVEKGSFYGVQFHAEKSSAAGLRLLANFARICIAAREPDAAQTSAHA